MAAYVALTKPRIITMVLVTVAVGYVLGCRNQAGPDWSNFLFTLVGTGLVAGGASAWNQYLERFRDSRMRRTAKRPLPSGKIEPIEAVLVGTFLTLLGVALLGLGSEPLAAGVAAVTFLLYVFLYTPLKPYTTLNTAVGAIPGALPPVIGWVAATGRLGIEAWALFLIVFLWQFPHFLAIAWLYRQDYSRAGFLMLPCRDPDGWRTGRHASSYALALVPVVLLPSALGLAGGLYFAGALLLSLFYLVSATRFWCQVNDRTARGLLRASIIHLPSTLMLLLLNSTVV
jgi:protoheme IX farnesyltransferase